MLTWAAALRLPLDFVTVVVQFVQVLHVQKWLPPLPSSRRLSLSCARVRVGHRLRLRTMTAARCRGEAVKKRPADVLGRSW